MEILLKCCAVLLVSGSAALMIRRSNPEFAFAAAVCAVCCTFAMAAPLLKGLGDLRDTLRRVYGLGDVYTLPVIKSCAAAIVSRLTADICRESSQYAAAGVVEFVGAACALAVSMPLISSMLSAVGEML